VREAPRQTEEKAASNLERFIPEEGINLDKRKALQVVMAIVCRVLNLRFRKSILKSPRINEGWYSDWSAIAKSESDKEGCK